MLETYLTASANIVFHPETGECNCEKRSRGQALDQIDSAPIGQTQVADEHVETARLRRARALIENSMLTARGSRGDEANSLASALYLRDLQRVESACVAAPRTSATTLGRSGSLPS